MPGKKKKKKNPIPFALRAMAWMYPKLERIAPSLAHRLFTKLFFSPVRYRLPEKEAIAENHSTPFTLTIPNYTIQGRTWGDTKKYVLVVHGWAGRSTQFRRFVKPLLAAGYGVVGFDGPAHGKSTGSKTTLIEFNDAFIKIYEKFGTPEAVIAHSFGGGAVLYAAMKGLPINRLINIASPTIGDDIIDTYLQALNGSQKTKAYFKDYILRTFQKPFDEFTASYFIKHLPHHFPILLVHDQDDKEVPVKQAYALKELDPSIQLFITEGLGHTRILRDNKVIETCVTFVKEGRLNKNNNDLL
jgi:pimeloyl-ACP methyl ester carboxylesterase